MVDARVARRIYTWPGFCCYQIAESPKLNDMGKHLNYVTMMTSVKFPSVKSAETNVHKVSETEGPAPPAPYKHVHSPTLEGLAKLRISEHLSHVFERFSSKRNLKPKSFTKNLGLVHSNVDLLEWFSFSSPLLFSASQ